MNYKYKTILIMVTLSSGMIEAFAGEKPSKNSLQLTDVIKSLKAKGYSSITKVDGRSPNNIITSTLSKESFLQ